MQRSDFHYDLPPELIAQVPLAERTASRLLRLGRNDPQAVDAMFSDVVDVLQPGDLLVMNDTRVIPARLFGQKSTGGKVEILLERLLDTNRCLAQIRASKSPKVTSQLQLQDGYSLEVVGRQDDMFELRYEPQQAGPQDLLALLDKIGHVPLPPYIDRPDNEQDLARYQTVYAAQPGAVAAPTAGLHFDEILLEQIRRKGVATATVTLHVGAGTFQPVRCDDITEHRMHEEWISVSESVVEAVRQTRQQGGRVVAIGTTSLRALEAAASIHGEIQPMQGLTDIFIFPGYELRVVDALVTNFHLPESTLLMLVCALGGYDRVLSAYNHAVKQHYRFFSYGDAMWLEPLAK